MILSPEMKAMFVPLLREMTPGQISTLTASLSEAESRIGTTRASAHYAFLKKLCDSGLAMEVPLEVELPSELQASLVSVSIKEEAKPAIARLLESLAHDPA